jgi:hypothetical protein
MLGGMEKTKRTSGAIEIRVLQAEGIENDGRFESGRK